MKINRTIKNTSGTMDMTQANLTYRRHAQGKRLDTESML